MGYLPGLPPYMEKDGTTVFGARTELSNILQQSFMIENFPYFYKIKNQFAFIFLYLFFFITIHF